MNLKIVTIDSLRFTSRNYIVQHTFNSQLNHERFPRSAHSHDQYFLCPHQSMVYTKQKNPVSRQSPSNSFRMRRKFVICISLWLWLCYSWVVHSLFNFFHYLNVVTFLVVMTNFHSPPLHRFLNYAPGNK